METLFQRHMVSAQNGEASGGERSTDSHLCLSVSVLMLAWLPFIVRMRLRLTEKAGQTPFMWREASIVASIKRAAEPADAADPTPSGKAASDRQPATTGSQRQAASSIDSGRWADAAPPAPRRGGPRREKAAQRGQAAASQRQAASDRQPASQRQGASDKQQAASLIDSGRWAALPLCAFALPVARS